MLLNNPPTPGPGDTPNPNLDGPASSKAAERNSWFISIWLLGAAIEAGASAGAARGASIGAGAGEGMIAEAGVNLAVPSIIPGWDAASLGLALLLLVAFGS